MPRIVATAELKDLPVADRLRLIEEIWDSIRDEGEAALPMPDWQRAEIDRRLDSLGDGTSAGMAWDDARRDRSA